MASENETEDCYVCQQPIVNGQKVYHLKDDEGLEWIAHKECAEREMHLVTPSALAGDSDRKEPTTPA